MVLYYKCSTPIHDALNVVGVDCACVEIFTTMFIMPVSFLLCNSLFQVKFSFHDFLEMDKNRYSFTRLLNVAKSIFVRKIQDEQTKHYNRKQMIILNDWSNLLVLTYSVLYWFKSIYLPWKDAWCRQPFWQYLGVRQSARQSAISFSALYPGMEKLLETEAFQKLKEKKGIK